MKKLMTKERLAAIMLISVVISLTLLPYFSIIGIVIISVTFMLPIFNR